MEKKKSIDDKTLERLKAAAALHQKRQVRTFPHGIYEEEDPFSDPTGIAAWHDEEKESAETERKNAAASLPSTPSITSDSLNLAMSLGAPASEVERICESSTLAFIVEQIAQTKNFGKSARKSLEWALATGANVRKLAEVRPLALVELACSENGAGALQLLAPHRELLVRTVGFNCSDGHAVGTPLHALVSLAVHAHDLSVAAQLLAEFSDPNERDSYGFSVMGRLNREAGRVPKSLLPRNNEAFRILAEAGFDPTDLFPPPAMAANSKEIAQIVGRACERNSIEAASGMNGAQRADRPKGRL